MSRRGTGQKFRRFVSRIYVGVRWVQSHTKMRSAGKTSPNNQPIILYLDLRFTNDLELVRHSLSHAPRPRTAVSLATRSLDLKKKSAGPSSEVAAGRTHGAGPDGAQEEELAASSLSCRARQRMTSCGTTPSQTPGPTPKATRNTK